MKQTAAQKAFDIWMSINAPHNGQLIMHEEDRQVAKHSATICTALTLLHAVQSRQLTIHTEQHTTKEFRDWWYETKKELLK